MSTSTVSSEWTRYVDENSGYPYWFNATTGESRWASEQEAAILYHAHTNSPTKPINNAPERRPEAFIYPGIHSPGGGFADQFVPHKQRGMLQYGQKAAAHVDIRQDNTANEASDDEEEEGSEYESNSDEEEEEEDDDDDEEDDEEEVEDDDDDDDEEDEEEEEDGSDNDSSDIEASPHDTENHNHNRSTLPPKMETAFQHYMQSSEGKMALETEQSRVEQAMELKKMKERRLMVRKQQYDARPKKGKKPKRTFAMAANAVLTAAWTPMTVVLAPIGSIWNSLQSASSSSSSSSNKNKKKRGKDASSSSSSSPSSHVHDSKHENHKHSNESIDLEGGTSTSMDEEEIRPPSASLAGGGPGPVVRRGHTSLDPQSPPSPPAKETPVKPFTHTKHPSNYRHDLIGKDEIPDVEGNFLITLDSTHPLTCILNTSYDAS